MLVLLLGFWFFAGFMPPHLPMASATEIAAIYQQNTTGIRVGMILQLISGALVAPFVAVISIQMRRIEGTSPVLAYTQLSAGTAGILLFIISAMIWTTAAYRPERPPELVQLLNDLGWLFFVMPFVMAFVQNFAIGFAILADKRAQPVFPRWVGFLNLWVAILFVPGGLVTFFKTGPFAWNGLLAFWLPLSVFGIWFGVMYVTLVRAIRQQEAQPQ